MKKLLSKSSINLYLQCPFKWKRCYIDEVKSIPSPQQERGIRIHEKIEKFYKNIKEDDELKTFISFELKRLKKLKAEGKLEDRYIYPLFQELKLENEELGLKGIIDVVFLNSTDDELVVLDYKTGKYKPETLSDYRLELAVYKELLEKSGLTDAKVKYWGIHFVDADVLFFEEVKEEYVKDMYETVELVREGIENKYFDPCPNEYCHWCQFKKECPHV